MFGRRRHIAPVVSAPAPRLTEDHIFDIVHTQIAAAIGEHGEWTLTRRAENDTDQIFYGVIAHSVAAHVVEALRIAHEQLEEREELEHAPSSKAAIVLSGDHIANPTAKDASSDSHSPAAASEPAALSWEPAPITKWTDLKKPVTGPIAGIRDHELVA